MLSRFGLILGSLAAILPITACYRFQVKQTAVASDYGTAEIYRRHSERSADLSAGCADSHGNTLAIADHGAAMLSNDGGSTWRRDDSIPEGIHGCLAWAHGIVAPSDSGIVFRTEGIGREWTPHQTPRLETLRQTMVMKDGELFVSGDHGAIVQSKDGHRWKDISLSSRANVIGLASCNEKAWAVTSSELWSRQQGKWTAVQIPFGDVTAIDCTARNGVLAIINRRGEVALSSDDGLNWHVVNTGFEARYPVFDLQDDTDWVAAGGSGIVLHSADHGLHWKAVPNIPVNVNLSGHMRVGANLLLFGQRGTVLMGTNSGSLHATAGKPIVLSHFLPSRLLRYGDGGWIQTSKQEDPPFNIGTHHDITAMVSGKSGKVWAATAYGGLYTSDDLHKWTRIYEGGVQGNTDFKGIAVTADDHTVVAAATAGQVYTFTDGAAPQVWRHSSKKDFRAVALSGQYGVAVGLDGERAWSKDSGAHWQEVNDDFSTTLYDVVFARGAVLAVGESGEILRSTDQGQSWTEIGEAEDSDLHSVSCAQSCSSLVAVGDDGSTWSSNDGGAHWDPSKQPRTDLLQVGWNNHSLWVMLGSGLLTPVASPSKPFIEAFDSTAYRVFVTQTGIWLGSKKGVILKSTDGGGSWQKMQTPAQKNIGGIGGTQDGREMWAVDTAGDIFSLSTSGTQWTQESFPNTVQLNSVSVVEDGVLAVGSGGLILRKEKGGSWSKTDAGVDVSLLEITTDETGRKVWVVGNAGTVLFSGDGGRHWKVQTVVQNIDLKSIARLQTPFGVRMVATGSNGGELLSLDEGAHWFWRGFRNSIAWSVVAIPSTQQFWAITDDGVLLNSNDFGEHWSETDLNTGHNSLYSLTVSTDGSSLYATGEGGVFERLDRIRSAYIIQSVDLRTSPGDIEVQVILAGYEGAAPNVTLQMARNAERQIGLSQVLPVSFTQSSVPGTLEYNVRSPLFDMSFDPGETVWVSPCLNFRGGDVRCIPMHPAVVKPLIDVEAHWKGIVAAIMLLALITTQTILLWVAPRYLLSIHSVLKTYESVLKDRIPFGTAFFEINKIMLVPLFAFSGKSLDAWVHRYAESLRVDLKDAWYVPLPIVVDESTARTFIGRPAPADLAKAMNSRHLSIVGSGGAGKTSLARQVGIWLSEKNEMTAALGCQAAVLFLRDRTEKTLESIQLEIQERLGIGIEPELIEALLKKGRLVIVLDSVSERLEHALIYLDELKSKLLARQVITTARAISAEGALLIQPQPLEADSLLYLMVLLLQREQTNVEADKIDMRTQLEVAQRLAAIVQPDEESSTITPLLVETFVAKAVSLLRQGADLEGLPKSVAEAYLSYVRELAKRSHSGVASTVLLYVAKHIARSCLARSYVPEGVEELKAIKTLGVEESVANTAIRSLLEVGLLMHGGGSLDTDLRFCLDPVAEYCAAMSWHETDEAGEWEARKRAAFERLPESQGFLRAMAAIEMMQKKADSPSSANTIVKLKVVEQ